jgi:hypothetical protein
MRASVFILVITCLAGAAPAQSSETGEGASGGSRFAYSALAGRVRDLESRLDSLSGTRPDEYLMLAEEIIPEAANPSDKRLARELLVCAITLEIRKLNAPADGTVSGAMNSTKKSQTAASACLALAQLADSDQERRWLIAIASTLGADLGLDPTLASATVASRRLGAFELATALGLARAGEGARAERMLAKPGVDDLLTSFDKILEPYIGGGADLVRKQIEEWPVCTRCRNRRAVKEGAVMVICPKCQGTPGPDLSPEDLENHLRAESLLLSGVQRSWSAQIVTDAGAPLRELDPAEIAAAYAVDPDRYLWRDGRWTRDPALPMPEVHPQLSAEPIAPSPPPSRPATVTFPTP